MRLLIILILGVNSIDLQAHHRTFTKKDRAVKHYSFKNKHHYQSTGKIVYGTRNC